MYDVNLFVPEQNGFCHMNSSQFTARIQSYTNVTSGSADALKVALFKNGPVAVSIDASHRSFVFYSHGVYYEPACGELSSHSGSEFSQNPSALFRNITGLFFFLRQHHRWFGPRRACSGIWHLERGPLLADKELLVHLLGQRWLHPHVYEG